MGFSTKSAWAVPASGKRFRFEAQLDLGRQAFDGVSGAAFKSFTRMSYGTSFSYTYASWENGLQFAITPGILFDPFVFSTNVSGAYSSKFFQYQYYSGIVFKTFRIHAIAGLERMTWSGSPTLGYTPSFDLQLGGQMSFDFLVWQRGGLYAQLRYIKHKERRYIFANFASDGVVVAPGNQFDSIVGAYVAF